MGVTLSPEIAARLHERAASNGIDENEMANALLAAALDLEGLGSDSEADAIEEGLRAFADGRERSFAAFISEHRAKYPASSQ